LPLYQTYLQQAGQAVLDSLWQFGILYMCYYLLRLAAAKWMRPAAEYWILVLLLLTGSGIFLINIGQVFTGRGYTGLWQPLQSPAVNGWLYYVITGSGLIYTLLFTLRIMILGARFLKRPSPALAAAPPQAAAFMPYLHDLCAYLRMKMPRIKFTTRQVSPHVSGFFKTAVILPVSLLNQLSEQETEAVLLHELAHLKRKDHWINGLVILAEQILFFNPFAREITARLKQQRELACDDWVLQQGVKPMHYATSLQKAALFEQFSAPAWQLPFNGEKAHLLHRIERLFGKGRHGYQFPVKRLLALPVILLALLAGEQAQQLNTPKPAGIFFEKVPVVKKGLPVLYSEKPVAAIVSAPVRYAEVGTPAKTNLRISKTALAEVREAVLPPADAVFAEVTEVADIASTSPFTTFITSGSHKSEDVLLKFTDSVLVYENFISRLNIEAATNQSLTSLLNIVAGMNDELLNQPQSIRLAAPAAPVTVTQDGGRNFYFNDTRLQQSARYQPATRQWQIQFVLLNGDHKLGERFVTIYQKRQLRTANL
jgi:Zn-dependent protease with chaperone function